MKLFFIIGYFNCGTTALTRLLKGHRDIKLFSGSAANEEEILIRGISKELNIDIASSPTDKFVKNGFDSTLIRTDEKTAVLFREKLMEKLNKRNFIKNNRLFFSKNLLDKAFPTTKRILIIRNGNSYAISKNYWQSGKDSGIEKLRNRAKMWNASMKYLWDVWKHDPHTLIVKYESLCTDTDITISRICDFLGLDCNKFESLYNFYSQNYKWESLEASLKKIVQKETFEMMKKLYGAV